MDKAHQTLVQPINDLEKAFTPNSVLDDCDKAAIREVLQHTESHFVAEECLLTRCKYPFVEQHTKLHDEMRHTIGNIRSALESGVDIAEVLMNFLMDMPCYTFAGIRLRIRTTFKDCRY